MASKAFCVAVDRGNVGIHYTFPATIYRPITQNDAKNGEFGHESHPFRQCVTVSILRASKSHINAEPAPTAKPPRPASPPPLTAPLHGRRPLPAPAILLLLAAIALSALTACVSPTQSAGQARIFAVRYETVTKLVWALAPNPDADSPFQGHDIVPGQSYQLDLPEGEQGPIHGATTTIVVTKIDSKSTRVQIKTIHAGFFLDTRDPRTEQQRMEELARLLANKISK
jgi:hypothetical protein